MSDSGPVGTGKQEVTHADRILFKTRDPMVATVYHNALHIGKTFCGASPVEHFVSRTKHHENACRIGKGLGIKRSQLIGIVGRHAHDLVARKRLVLTVIELDDIPRFDRRIQEHGTDASSSGKPSGIKATETGAGQWGTALSMACAYLGLDLKVFMVKCSYEQKPFRREVMRTYGASVTPSPSNTTNVGRAILAKDPDTTGSLGCAISEAVEVATTTPGYRYVLGSVLNQVLLHQSVIGLETKIALDKYGITPDIIIGCAGGGSNLGGLIAPFMGEKLRGEKDYRFIAVEPASCPSFTRGVFAYDFCDTGMVCPLAKMYTLGSGFIPSANHAGGLRYHGMSPILSQLYHDGLMEARSVEQTSVFEAAEYFARTEGILPAPESSHAICAAIDEALKCKETGEEKTIVFGLTGTGYFDLVAYQKFNDHEMTDIIPTDEQLAASIAKLPKVAE